MRTSASRRSSSRRSSSRRSSSRRSSSRRSSLSDTEHWFGSLSDRSSRQSSHSEAPFTVSEPARRSMSQRVTRSSSARPTLDDRRDLFASPRSHSSSSDNVRTYSLPTPSKVRNASAVRSNRADDLSHETDNSLTTQTTKTLQHFTDTVRRGVGASAETDAAMLDTMRDAVRPAHAYTATYFVLKLLILSCLVGYTASLDPKACPCAEDGRKYVILWGGGFVMGLCLVAVALPDVYRQNPMLKALLMVLTFVVLYSVVTYFPMLNALDCVCANDWRRWLVEGIVYAVLAVFLLTLVGVVSV